VRIELLTNHRDAIPTLAQWFYEEWSHFRPGWTVRDFENSLAGFANTDKIPLALVALEEEELIGAVCLDPHDMETRMDLSPWLAGLYVKQAWRNHGVGTSLVHAIEGKAAELGVPGLYLYTADSERFYARLGWTLREPIIYHGRTVSIMQKTLSAQEHV
jgi:GNAT superfamily N-acetyltransferase